MRLALIATALVGLCWLFPSQAGAQTVIVTGQGPVIGNGRLVSRERPITAVTVLDLNGAFELTIVVGQPPHLTLTGEENILPTIKTSISDDRLSVFSDRSYTASRAIRVTVAVPHLTSLETSGSNRIEGRNIDGDELSVSLSGSNSAALVGKVAALIARLDGSNRLSAAQLIADSVNIRVAGSGDASLDAQEHIAAEIFGSGSITVHGNPKDRRTQVNGSGKITFPPEDPHKKQAVRDGRQ